MEPLAELDQKEGLRLGAKEEFAKRVAMNLYHFLESFHGVAPGPDSLVVPANFLDRWYVSCFLSFFLFFGVVSTVCVERIEWISCLNTSS